MSCVSVIIPVFNHEILVRECVESVLKQTYKDVEIILVNDFSTDRSSEVCKKMEQEYENVFYYEQASNQGPLAARVRGIMESRGEHIVFCDADDMLPKNCVESLMSGQEKMKTNLIIGNFAQKYDDKILDNKSKMPEGIYKNEEILDKQIDDGSLSGIFISSQCGKLYERKIVDRFVNRLPLDVRINEDGVFNTYYLLNSENVGVISNRVYIERSRKRTGKKQVNLELFEPANQALMKLGEEWPNKESFNIQMKRRKISNTFILSLWVCNYSDFFEARKLLKRLWKELEVKKLQDVVTESNMRLYKRIFFKLMKYKCYLLFYVGIRISPMIRKYVAR